MLKAKKGRLLIAEPSLNDSIFFKSVVLVTHHSDKESIGIILNKPTKINLHEILDDIPLSDFPLYIGGPVAKQSLHFIHTLGEIIPNSKRINNNIYFGGDFDAVIQLMHDNHITKDEIRFFVGYSGWDKGQLNNEIQEDSWIVERVKDNLCMNYSTPELWSNLMKTKKQKYAIWANMPKDPSLN
ncbi:YqgE/AlgH family protein [Flavobacteriales bacterium]|nr:YqgE/AlgH family protein [Flavobacteriales bacterium]